MRKKTKRLVFIAIGLFDPEPLRLIGWYPRIGTLMGRSFCSARRASLLAANSLRGEAAAAPAPSASPGGNYPKDVGPRTVLGDLRLDI